MYCRVSPGVCLGAGAFGLVTGVVSLQAADLPLVTSVVSWSAAVLPLLTGVVPSGTGVVSPVAVEVPREPDPGVVETVHCRCSLKSSQPEPGNCDNIVTIRS